MTIITGLNVILNQCKNIMTIIFDLNVISKSTNVYFFFVKNCNQYALWFLSCKFQHWVNEGFAFCGSRMRMRKDRSIGVIWLKISCLKKIMLKVIFQHLNTENCLALVYLAPPVARLSGQWHKSHWLRFKCVIATSFAIKVKTHVSDWMTWMYSQPLKQWLEIRRAIYMLAIFVTGQKFKNYLPKIEEEVKM